MSNENNNIITTAPDVAKRLEYYNQQADFIVDQAIQNRRPLTADDFKALRELDRAIRNLKPPMTRMQEERMDKERRHQEAMESIKKIRMSEAAGRALFEARREREAAANADKTPPVQ